MAFDKSTWFTIHYTELTGDLDFIYVLERVQTVASFVRQLARDPQLSDYVTRARLLGMPWGTAMPVQITFANFVICGTIELRTEYLVIYIQSIYLPASILDVEFKSGNKGYTIPHIATNIYIKRVEGYKFRSKMLTHLTLRDDKYCRVHLDKWCLQGAYLYRPIEFTDIHRKIYADRVDFGNMSNYMKNCTIKKINSINLLGIEKFFKAGNRVEAIEELFTHKEFKLVDSILPEKVIFDYLQSVVQITVGAKIRLLSINFNILGNDIALLVQQLDVISNAFLHSTAPIQIIDIESRYTDGSKSWGQLTKKSDDYVEITYPTGREMFRVGKYSLVTADATTNESADKTVQVFLGI